MESAVLNMLRETDKWRYQVGDCIYQPEAQKKGPPVPFQLKSEYLFESRL